MNNFAQQVPEKKQLLYVFRCGPYSTATGQEALDAVLVGTGFEQHISLLFLHDGVFQLKTNQANQKDQTAQTDALKQYTNTFKALADFDVRDVYVHDLSLTARGLRQQDLMVETHVLSSDDVGQLIAWQDRVFTF